MYNFTPDKRKVSKRYFKFPYFIDSPFDSFVQMPFGPLRENMFKNISLFLIVSNLNSKNTNVQFTIQLILVEKNLTDNRESKLPRKKW